MLAHQAEDLAPLLGRHGAVAHDAANQAVRRLPAARKQEDNRERDLAFAQIAADRLAERGRVGGVVEEIVDQLERDAEIEPVIAERGFLFRASRRRASRQSGRSRRTGTPSCAG